MEAKQLVYMDVETTGLRTEYDRIVSISGLIVSEPQNIVFNALVNPTVPIPDEASRVHGLCDADVAQCENFKQVGERFFKWVYEHAGKHPVLAAYNGLGYDFQILWHEAKRWKCTLPPFESVRGYDPLRAARVVLRLLPSKRQAEVYRHLFGEPPDKQHTSLGDVLAMERIVRHDVFANTFEDHTKPLRFTSSQPSAAPARAQASRG